MVNFSIALEQPFRIHWCVISGSEKVHLCLSALLFTSQTVSKSNECLASSYQGCFQIPQPRFQNTLEMKSIVLIWYPPPPLLFVMSLFPEALGIRTKIQNGERKRCVRKAFGQCRHVLHFLIRQEKGNDVTGSQTGCSDYNTMRMPGHAI